MKRTSHVHDLCTERSHTCSTANPYHLFLRVKYRMEISIRSTHNNFISWFKSKDIRRGDTRHYFLETDLRFRFERRCSYTHSQHNTVTFGWIVCHRICTYRRYIILAFKTKEPELLPCRKIFVSNQLFINIFIIVHLILRNLYLCITARKKVHVLAWRQCHNKLFDKCSDILITDYFTLPLLYTKNTFGYLYRKVTFYLALTS